MGSSQNKVAVLAASVLLVHACLSVQAQVNPMGTRTAPGDTPTAEGTGGAGDNPQVMRDNGFLHRTAEAGMGEIEISKLAAQNASSDDVKKLAQKLVDDQTAVSQRLQPIADASKIDAPKKLAKQDQQELAKLGKLSGTDFDKEYLSYEIKTHHKELQDFRTEAANAYSPRLKDAAGKGAQTIQDDTGQLEKLGATNGVK